MAISLGTNSGFVSSAPSSDPGGSSAKGDDNLLATKDTSPTGSYKVTELGLYQNRSETPGRAYELGVYTHDAANNRPNAVVGAIQTGSSTTAYTPGWYKYSGLSIDLVSNTAYWICAAFAGTYDSLKVSFDYATSGGAGEGWLREGGPNLPSPWSEAFTTYDAGGMAAIYALYEAANAEYTGAGVETPSGAFSRLLASLRTYLSAITPSGSFTRLLNILRHYSSSISPSGTFSRLLSILRTYLGDLSPAGAFTRLLAIIRLLGGILELSGLVNRLVQKLRVYSSEITFAGSAQRLSQNIFARLKDGAVSIESTLSRYAELLRIYLSELSPSGILSRTIEALRSYASELTLEGVVSYSKAALYNESRDGALNLVADFFKLFEGNRLYSSALDLSGTVARLSQNIFSRTKDGILESAGALSRIISTTRTTIESAISFAGEVSYSGLEKVGTYLGELDLSGSINRLITTARTAITSTLDFAGTATRFSEIARTVSGALNLEGIGERLAEHFLTGRIYKQILRAATYASELSFSGTVSTAYNWLESAYGALSSAGDVTRNIITRKTVSGRLMLAGIAKQLGVYLLTGSIGRQVERAKTYASELSFSGIVDGVKLHIYESVLSLEGAVSYLYGKLNIHDGVLHLSGAVTYSYDFLKSTLGGVVDLYGLVQQRLSLGRLTAGALDLAGAIYYAIAEMFTESKSGSITPSGQVRKGRGKTTSGGLFGGGGDTGFVFDKGGDFTFADSSDYIWGSSIGIVTWVLTQLRLYPGVITPTGRAMRWLQGSGRESGAITTSSVVTRRLNLLRQPSGALDFSGSYSVPSQGTDLDRLGYLNVQGAPSRLVSKLRSYASQLNLAGTIAVSKIGLIWWSGAGQLDIAASVSRRLEKFKLLRGTAIPATQVIWFWTLLRRYLVLARTKAGQLDLAGVVSWVLADRFGLVSGVLDLVGVASRSSVLARAKDGLLTLAGEARAYIGYMTFPKPIGDLVIAGSVSRVIDITNLRVGSLVLVGVPDRQSELNRSDAGSLTFSGEWDEWREALYYGPEI